MFFGLFLHSDFLIAFWGIPRDDVVDAMIAHEWMNLSCIKSELQANTAKNNNDFAYRFPRTPFKNRNRFCFLI